MPLPIQTAMKRSVSGTIGILRFYLPALLVSIVFTVASIIVMKGAFIHPELYERIPHLISSKPLIARIFDSRVMDYDMYQARELSYLGDQIDAAVIFEMIQRGMPNMISTMHYLLGTMAVVMLYGFYRKDLGLGKAISLLLVALAWSAPCMLFGGNYFRTAKIGATVSMVAVCIVTYRLLARMRSGEGGKAREQWVLGGLALLMTLWDRQGFYMALCLVALLVIMGGITREKRIISLLVPVLAAIGTSTLYNLFVAPSITYALNGYWPDFSYQQLPWKEIHRDLPILLADGAILLWRELWFALGNRSAWITLCIFLSATYLAWRKDPSVKADVFKHRYGQAAWIAFFITSVVMVIIMNALMLARMRGLYIPVFQRTYYTLPVTFLWLILLGIALARIRIMVPKKSRVLPIVCLLLLSGNLMAFPEHMDMYSNQYFKHFIEPSNVFFQGLREVYEGKDPTEESLRHDVLFRILSHRMHHDLPEVTTTIKYTPY